MICFVPIFAQWDFRKVAKVYHRTLVNVRNGVRLWTTLSKVSTGQEPEVPTDKVSGVEASRFGIESNQVESCGLGINIRGFPRLIVRKALLSWFQCAGS